MPYTLTTHTYTIGDKKVIQDIRNHLDEGRVLLFTTILKHWHTHTHTHAHMHALTHHDAHATPTNLKEPGDEAANQN